MFLRNEKNINIFFISRRFIFSSIPLLWTIRRFLYIARYTDLYYNLQDKDIGTQINYCLMERRREQYQKFEWGTPGRVGSSRHF